VGSLTRAGTEDTGAGNAEGHLPSLHHARPRIHARGPADVGWARRVVAGLATASATTLLGITVVVEARGHGLAVRRCTGVGGGVAGVAVAGRRRGWTRATGGDQSMMGGRFVVLLAIGFFQ
jgi:hypothetical protein